jgi:peptidyl-prolyl cis-trans isomerase-like protein 2
MDAFLHRCCQYCRILSCLFTVVCSFQPFEDPVCTPKGVVYDLLYAFPPFVRYNGLPLMLLCVVFSNIVPFLQKHKTDPMTGDPLTPKELIKLTFHKNNKGEYHCPVTFKVFTDYTHIVAVRTSGHVYAMEVRAYASYFLCSVAI